LRIIKSGWRNLNLTKFRTFLRLLLQEIEVSPKKIKDFGWVMFAVLGLIVPLFISYRIGWEINTAMLILFALSQLILIPSILVPRLMEPIYKAWMLLALLLGLFMTKVIITIVFIVIMTPIGLVRQLFVRDPLKLKADKNATTYWVKKEDEFSAERYEKQY